MYNKANIPNIKELADNGCYTLTKRSIIPSSSAPNWASMFMGVGPEIHGYTKWDSNQPEFPPLTVNENGMFPTIFYLLNKQQTEKDVSVFYEWDGIKSLIDYKAVDYYRLCEYDNGDLSKQVCTYIDNNTVNLMAVIWDGLDHVGHSFGFNSDEYVAKLEEIDLWIGEIIKAIKKKNIFNESIIILTSDHGGIDNKHGGITDEEMETPFIVFGKNIHSGKKICTPIIQYDIPATIAYIFDINRPIIWTGKPIFEIFVKN